MVSNPKAVALIKKMNLKMAFGLSLKEIEEMTLVERNYWVWIAKCLERKKKMDKMTRSMKR